MAVGAPQRHRQVAEGPLELPDGEGIVDATVTIKDGKIQGMPVQAAAPPPEDLLGYYIFTTYHLLLKEIRDEAGDIKIFAVKSNQEPLPPQPSQDVGQRT